MEAQFGGRLVGRTGPSRAAKAGRVCTEVGCTTVLSIYNLGDKCLLHRDSPIRITESTKRRRLNIDEPKPRRKRK